MPLRHQSTSTEPSSSSTASTVAEKRQDASDTAQLLHPKHPLFLSHIDTPVAPVTPTEPMATIAAKPSGPVRPPFLRHIEPRILQGVVCQFVVNSKLPSWIVATPPTDNCPKVGAPAAGRTRSSGRSANVRRSPTWPWRPRSGPHVSRSGELPGCAQGFMSHQDRTFGLSASFLHHFNFEQARLAFRTCDPYNQISLVSYCNGIQYPCYLFMTR